MDLWELFLLLTLLTNSAYIVISGDELHPFEHVEKVLSPDENKMLKVFVGMLKLYFDIRYKSEHSCQFHNFYKQLNTLKFVLLHNLLPFL